MPKKLSRLGIFFIAVILQASSANAQPVFRTYKSLESRVAQAEAIYVGTVSKCTGVFIETPNGFFGGHRDDATVRPDGVMHYTVTVKVNEVLKGKPLRTLQLSQETDADDKRFKQWADSHTLFLWFIGCDQWSNLGQSADYMGETGDSQEKHTPWHTIRLGMAAPAENGYTKDSPVYLMDFTHLIEPDDILANVQNLANSPCRKTLQFHEFTTIPNGSPFDRLIVPVQPKLEKVARCLITAPEDFVGAKDKHAIKPELRRMLRAEGVDALRYFKSSQNSQLLKSLLNDSDSYLLFDDDTNISCRKYPIRSKAYGVLKMWRKCAPQLSTELAEPKKSVSNPRVPLPTTLGASENRNAKPAENAMSSTERQERRERLISKGILRDGGKSLEQYDVEDISDRDLQALTPSDLRSLRRVSLRYGVGDEGLAYLRQASCLCWLGYESSSIGDEGLRAIGQLRGLRRLLLSIQDQRVEDRSLSAHGLKHLVNLPCLTELQIWGRGITDDGVKELGRLKQLWSLDIGSPLIGDHALQYVATLPNMEELAFRSPEFDGSGLAYLANHSRLKKLTLDTRRFKGHGLSKLSGIKSLRVLDLPGYATISATNAAELTPLTQLTHLSFRGTGAKSCGDETFSAVGRLHQLESLSIGNCTITDEGIARLRGCTHLQELILSGDVAELSDDGMQTIASFERLRKLLVDKGANRITDAGLHHLTRLKYLKWLALDGNQLTDNGIREMAHLDNLRYLAIEGTRVTDAGREVATKVSQRQNALGN